MFAEALESRRMLAAAGDTFKSGGLNVGGGSKADSITVVENNGSAHLELTDPKHRVFATADFTGVSAIKIQGGGQADTIFYTGNSIGAVINGGGGNDFI